jgi:hypothetical protein
MIDRQDRKRGVLCYLQILPTTLVSHVFSWLDVCDHVILCMCARFLASASRLRASSCPQMTVTWRPEMSDHIRFRWSPRHLTLRNTFDATYHVSSNIHSRKVCGFILSVAPPLQSLIMREMGTPLIEMCRSLRHLVVENVYYSGGVADMMVRREKDWRRDWWRGLVQCTQLETLRYPWLRLLDDTFDVDVKPHPTLQVVVISGTDCQQPECTFLANITELSTIHVHHHYDSVCRLLFGLKLTRLTISNTTWTALRLPVLPRLHTLDLLDMCGRGSTIIGMDPTQTVEDTVVYIPRMAPNLQRLQSDRATSNPRTIGRHCRNSQSWKRWT